MLNVRYLEKQVQESQAISLWLQRNNKTVLGKYSTFLQAVHPAIKYELSTLVTTGMT